jgi:DNA/RNA-binding domain of Phe-tRNA-synthetase-like protein
MLTVEPHPLLHLHAFVTDFPRPLGEVAVPASVSDLLRPEAAVPDLRGGVADEALREAVRALLRHGGFKPTGRSKPASEYLVKAVREGTLSSINLAVDTCNVVSLHSGLPVSVVDLDRAVAPFKVGIAPAGSSYVFNASGQVIDVAGLLCLFDAEGPCANAVKDAQRTKTSAATTRTLSLIWGTRALPGLLDRAADRYHRLLGEAGARVAAV